MTVVISEDEAIEYVRNTNEQTNLKKYKEIIFDIYI
jgi:hypothetical protein